MRHFIRSQYLSNDHEEPIDDSHFELLKSSRFVLNAAFEAEDVFNHLLSNYIRAETECLGTTASRLVHRNTGYSDAYDDLNRINLAFMNYFSTARAYVDKIGSISARCFDEHKSKEIKETVTKKKREQYDSSFDYRFVEAIRNYVQHSGSALHQLTQSSRRIRTPDKAPRESETYLTPIFRKNDILNREKFNARFLRECPDEVNLIKSVRGHLYCLSNVHRFVREQISEPIKNAKHQIQQAQSLLNGKVEGDLDAAAAVAQVDDHVDHEVISLALQWEMVREKLTKRNLGVPVGSNAFPSGRIA